MVDGSEKSSKYGTVAVTGCAPRSARWMIGMLSARMTPASTAHPARDRAAGRGERGRAGSEAAATSVAGWDVPSGFSLSWGCPMALGGADYTEGIRGVEAESRWDGRSLSTVGRANS